MAGKISQVANELRGRMIRVDFEDIRELRGLATTVTRSNARSINRRRGAPNKRTRTRSHLVRGDIEIKFV
jgi:hypothetical protein